MSEPAVLAQEEDVADRIRRLQDEARELSTAAIGQALTKLRAAALDCNKIAGGGQAYPDGIKQALGKLAESILNEVQQVEAIAARASQL